MTWARWLEQRHRARERAGLVRTLRPRPAACDRIDLAGNDYLGMCGDPRVTRAAAEASLRWGAGAGASRLVSGSLELHVELEAELARFTERPASLVLSTGYQANLAVVSALADTDTLVISDAHVHASLVDACRLSHSGGLVVAPHNDPAAVEAALRLRAQPRALVLVESVYSVLGDAAWLRELASVVEQHDALLVVDEAHAIGVSGSGGRGLVEAAGLARRPDVVSTVTLSKALGSQGGAVLASPDVIRQLVNTARPFIYDTGLAPAAAAAALEALRIIGAEPGLPARTLEMAATLAGIVQAEPPAGAVVSVPMPGPVEALHAQAELASVGIDVGCFRPPSAPGGESRLRLTARADLAPDDLRRVSRWLNAVVAP